MYVVKIPRSKFYQLVYFVNGKRTTVSTKKTSLNEANKFLNNFRITPSERPKPINSLIALSSFRDEYVEFLELTKSKDYIRSVKLSFKMLIEFTCDIKLTDLDLRTIDKFITTTFSRTQRGASLYYRTLKAAFSKAVLWNYISENPLKKVKSPKVAKTFPMFLSEVELQLILGKTKEDYFKNLFFIAFYTGMRLGELVNMKWSWINFNENQITIQCSDVFTTKSKRDRIIPITNSLQCLLKSIFPKILNFTKEDYVFTDASGIKLNEDFVSKKFKKAVRDAELDERIHFHSLRHSFASLLVQRGVSLYVVKELLGHEALITTQIYSHLQQQNLRNAVNLL